ncbi:hypothetical protein D3C74_463280 [compost metagenome]
MSAWIEIPLSSSGVPGLLVVALHVSAWIEIRHSHFSIAAFVIVALYMSATIDTAHRKEHRKPLLMRMKCLKIYWSHHFLLLPIRSIILKILPNAIPLVPYH